MYETERELQAPQLFSCGAFFPGGLRPAPRGGERRSSRVHKHSPLGGCAGYGACDGAGSGLSAEQRCARGRYPERLPRRAAETQVQQLPRRLDVAEAVTFQVAFFCLPLSPLFLLK